MSLGLQQAVNCEAHDVPAQYLRNAFREEVLLWLSGAQARSGAQAVVRQHRLPAHVTDDVLQDAWLRANNALLGVGVPPACQLEPRAGAAAYGRAVITTTVRDRVKRAYERREVLYDGSSGADPTGSSVDLWPAWKVHASAPLDVAVHVDFQVAMAEFRFALGRMASAPALPDASPGSRLACIAMYVCDQLLLAAAIGDRGISIDELVYDGLRRYDVKTFRHLVDGSVVSAAQRQKKRRVLAQVKQMLADAAQEVGLCNGGFDSATA